MTDASLWESFACVARQVSPSFNTFFIGNDR